MAAVVAAMSTASIWSTSSSATRTSTALSWPSSTTSHRFGVASGVSTASMILRTPSSSVADMCRAFHRIVSGVASIIATPTGSRA